MTTPLARQRTIVGAFGLAALALIGVGRIAGQRPSSGAEQRIAGKPNLNGIWQAVNAADWDIEAHEAEPSPAVVLGATGAIPPGLSIIEGDGKIPYQPWALAKRAENRKKRLERDPEIKCYLPGVPRATYLPHPFQLVQSVGRIWFVYGYSYARRDIHMDKHEESPADFWMGWSNGHWEGDTLVIDVTSFVQPTDIRPGEPATIPNWLDRSGNFYSENLHVVERYTPLGPNHLMYEATLDDSTVYTRPWTISMPLYRRLDKNMQLLEFPCVELTEQLRYGRLMKKTSK